MKDSRSLTFLLLYCLIFSTAPPPARAQGCFVQDAASPTPEGVCGTNLWDLAVFSPNQGESHYGTREAYGVCIGGYYDCDNNYVEPDHINGEEVFSDDGPGEFGEEFFHWTLDDWTVTPHSCNNGNPSDEYETYDNYPYESGDFSVIC